MVTIAVLVSRIQLDYGTLGREVGCLAISPSYYPDHRLIGTRNKEENTRMTLPVDHTIAILEKLVGFKSLPRQPTREIIGYIGPGSISRAHKPDEYITVDELKQGLEFMQKLSGHLCGQTVSG